MATAFSNIQASRGRHSCCYARKKHALMPESSCCARSFTNIPCCIAGFMQIFL